MARRVRTKSSRQARRKKLEHELDTVNLDAAGIDIGAESIVAAVPKGRTPEGEHVCTFQSFVCSLRELANWLKACGVCTVAMESTGVYWIPLYELLEDEGFEVYLVDARKVSAGARRADVQAEAPSSAAASPRHDRAREGPQCIALRTVRRQGAGPGVGHASGRGNLPLFDPHDVPDSVGARRGA